MSKKTNFKKICYTGVFSVKNAELEEILKSAGHVLVNIDEGEPDVLLVGNPRVNGAKIKKAEQRKIKILKCFVFKPEKILQLLVDIK